MANDYQIDDGYLILDIPEIPSYGEDDVLILKDGKVKSLDKMSPLIGILKGAHKNQWSIGVYTPKDNLVKVSKGLTDLESYLE